MSVVTRGGEAASVDIDIFSDDFVANPFAYHDRLRDAGPVIWLEKYGAYGVARHAEVVEVLRDWQTFSSGRGLGLADISKGDHWRRPSLLAESDPPDHDRVRKIMNRVVSPVALRALRAKWEEKTKALVDELVECGEVDAVQDIAIRFTTSLFPELVGMRKEGRENIFVYSEILTNSIYPSGPRFEEAMRVSAPAIQWVEESSKRKNLDEGGWGMQVFRAADEGLCSEEEAELLVRAFVGAGIDTTYNSIANAIYAFATHPDQWQRLRAEPTLVKRAFDEALRWDATIQGYFRTTNRPVELAGVNLPEGAKIYVFLGAANRDPRRWDDPDTFDILRNTSGHVAFGFGIHQCLGQMVARLEAEVLLNALVERVSEFRLTGTPKYRINNSVHGLQSLPVRLVAGS